MSYLTRSACFKMIFYVCNIRFSFNGTVVTYGKAQETYLKNKKIMLFIIYSYKCNIYNKRKKYSEKSYTYKEMYVYFDCEKSIYFVNRGEENLFSFLVHSYS